MEIENEVTIATHNGSQVARQHNLRNPKVIVKEDHIAPNGHFEVLRCGWTKTRNQPMNACSGKLSKPTMPSRPDRQITGLKVFIHLTWAYETGNLKLANQARFATDAEMFAAVEERKIVIAAVNGVFGE